MIAAYISVYGFVRISPFLQEKIRLVDTCGVHNLHGMPGIFGAIVSAIALGSANGADIYPDGAFKYSVGKQAGMQLVGICVSVGIAIATGLVTGWVLKLSILYFVFCILYYVFYFALIMDICRHLLLNIGMVC